MSDIFFGWATTAAAVGVGFASAGLTVAVFLIAGFLAATGFKVVLRTVFDLAGALRADTAAFLGATLTAGVLVALGAVVFVVVFLTAGRFLATVCLTRVFFAAVFLAGAFLVAVFLATTLRTDVFFALVFFTTGLLFAGALAVAAFRFVVVFVLTLDAVFRVTGAALRAAAFLTVAGFLAAGVFAFAADVLRVLAAVFAGAFFVLTVAVFFGVAGFFAVVLRARSGFAAVFFIGAFLAGLVFLAVLTRGLVTAVLLPADVLRARVTGLEAVAGVFERVGRFSVV